MKDADFEICFGEMALCRVPGIHHSATQTLFPDLTLKHFLFYRASS